MGNNTSAHDVGSSSAHKFPYEWRLADGYPPKNGLKVMSTFCCGGGSSMGYKLAGYDVVAANDIDPEMRDVYLANNHVDKFYLCPIKDLLKADDLPKVDILDGSPPCSTFSMAGAREKYWGVKKKFREGQQEQVLDELFFDFIELAKKMRPPVVIAENVEGILLGNAKKYAREIVNRLQNIGYTVQVFKLNATSMGCPTIRTRAFFVCNLPGKKIKLEFNEPSIPFSEISDNSDVVDNLTPLYHDYWENAAPGQSVGRYSCNKKQLMHRPVNTIVSSSSLFHPVYKRELNELELKLAQTFPVDYRYKKEAKGQSPAIKYVIGMSVPPVMMAQVANQVAVQIFGKKDISERRKHVRESE